MEKEKSNPYTFFILRYRLVNLQGGIFAFEKEKNCGRRKNRKTKSTGIDGVMSEDMEAKVWEKRMPDLAPAEQLAVEIDRFSHDYDVYSYRNNNQNMTESVSEISEMIVQGNTESITDWLSEVISEGALPDEMQRAKVLLEKLAEYKPLAKIEEMEEQNYNMIDNVLNNGAEKVQKEVNKKELEQNDSRISLKVRLTEKKARVADYGKESQKNQKITREI